MAGKLLQTEEVAERLGVAPATVRRYIREGRLPAQKTAGEHYRIAEADLLSFLGSSAPPARSTRIIAFANQKGGVAKTTSAAALGAAWADRGLRVLLVDFDPQASLTTALGIDPGPALYGLMTRYVERGDVPSVLDALNAAIRVLPGGEHLLPSHLDLAAAELELITAMRREYILADLLSAVADRYDVIAIDCPPTLGLLTVNGLTAATDVLIPVTPEYLAAQGLGRLIQTAQKIRRHLNKGLAIAGVLPTMVKPTTRHHREVLEQIATICKANDIPVFGSIPDTIRAADAAGQGVAITRYPGGDSAAQAYRHLALQLIPEEVAHAR
ncbi:MAG TPA: AAA family ATPase [Chloroflexia bacterium]|nr:AAA family ATPase [Chloroflexia bacterium]